MATKKNSSENILAALTYLLGPITGIFFLLTEKKNDLIRFHAMQSTLTFGGIWILHLALSYLPLFGWFASYVLSILSFLLWVYLMWKAFNAEKYELPYLGKWSREQLKKI